MAVERRVRGVGEYFRAYESEADPFQALLGLRETHYAEVNWDLWWLHVMGSHMLAAFELWKTELVGRFEAEGRGDLVEVMQQEQEDLSNYRDYAAVWGQLTWSSAQFRDRDVLVDFQMMQRGEFFPTIRRVISQATDAFQATITLPEWEDIDEVEVTHAYRIWLRYLLQNKAWIEAERKIGVPLTFELPLRSKLLPKTMNLGGMPYELRFGRFYVPSTAARRSPYNRRLWNFMAPIYEAVSDLSLKHTVFELLMETFQPSSGQPWKLLDVGQGTGLLSLHVQDQVELWGVDIADGMCAIAGKREKRDGSRSYRAILQSEANRIAVKDDFFDAAVMSFVEVWFNRMDFVTVMRELRRVVRPGGGVVVNIHKPDASTLATVEDLVRVNCGFGEVGLVATPIEYGRGRETVIYKLLARA